MNKQVFYSEIRKSLFGKLSDSQVKGMDIILDAFDEMGVVDNREKAYDLATTYHECAATMLPIEEYGKGRNYKYGKRVKMNGTPYTDTANIFYGRGYVQLTWYDNYLKAGKKLGLDLINNPNKVLEPSIAAKIMILGMREGWFTGKKISDYINDKMTDYVNARRIINGTDKAANIARYAILFQRALDAAK